MFTTQSRRPSTSKRSAVPGFTSLTAHTRTSRVSRTSRTSRVSDTGTGHGIAVLDLLDHAAPEGGDERRQGQLLEHVVEEAEHDEALGFLRGHPAAGEVVELLVVDGA